MARFGRPFAPFRGRRKAFSAPQPTDGALFDRSRQRRGAINVHLRRPRAVSRGRPLEPGARYGPSHQSAATSPRHRPRDGGKPPHQQGRGATTLVEDYVAERGIGSLECLITLAEKGGPEAASQACRLAADLPDDTAQMLEEVAGFLRAPDDEESGEAAS